MEHMTGMKSKRRMLLGAACLFFIFLAGCGTKKYDSTTLVFEKTGSITLNIVEAWDESLYDFNELTALNEKEVNEYNASSHSVTIMSSELIDGRAEIVMEYADDDSYYDLNRKNLFYGRADKAKNAGYNLVKQVRNVGTGELLLPAQWNEMESEKVIAVSELLDIVTPSEILYTSAGIAVTGEKTATVTVAEGLEFIICK